MKNKSLLLLAVTLGVLCIAGTAYAHWEKIIRIDGYARTGTLDWVWSDANSLDEYSPIKWNEDQTCEDGFIRTGGLFVWDTDKDVAWTEAGVSDDPHYMWYEIYNAYPSYCVQITTHIDVTGSIPIHLYQVVFRNAAGAIIGIIEYDTDKVVQMDVDGNGKLDVEIKWNKKWFNVDPYGEQFHYGDYEEVSWYTHFLNSADPLTEYYFTVELTGVNYNEMLCVDEYCPPPQ